MCKNILLDVDGVVADFVGGMMVAHKKPWPYSGVFGEDAWHLDRIWGIEPEAFWAPCGYEFWATLEKMPEADLIVSMCASKVGHDRLCFITSPCMTDGCMDGKRDWLKTHYPGIPVLFTLGVGGTPPKQFCAGRDSILIDDYSQSVDKFITYGGHAFLVARPWNRNYDRERLILEDMDDFLDDVLFAY